MKRLSKARIGALAAATLAVAIAAYALAIRPWHLRWGATDAEVLRALPGDDLVSHPRLNSTRAITIDAPAEAVWPWLVQMGKGRGGFYTYDWIENLLGFDVHSVDRIVPDLQHLQVGDRVSLHPNMPPLRVAVLEPDRAIVLGSSWAFVLDRVDERTTRLIIRSRGHYQPDFGGVGNFLVWRLLYEPAYFVMERKMLFGIKERAETRSAWQPVRSDP